MRFPDFLTAIYAPEQPPKVDRAQMDSTELSAKLGDISLPLYGELLGIETEIRVRIGRFSRKLALQFSLAAQRIQNQIGCSREDGAVGLVDALQHGGIYTAWVEGKSIPFDSSLIENYAEILKLAESVYDSDTLLGINDETELRYLAYDSSEAWDTAGVQGKTVPEQLGAILSNYNLKTKSKIVFVDLSKVIKSDDEVFQLLETYEYAESNTLLMDLLLYTRCGVSHEVSKYIGQKTINKFLDAVRAELNLPAVIATNTVNPELPEVEENTEGK